jgi:ribonucleoside-diphosphate reductase alpha chain
MDNVVMKKPRKKTKKHTFDEVFKASSAYFGNDPLPADVWADKYCLRDKEDNYLELTPDDMHDRLAAKFARIDAEKYGLDYDERFEIYRDAIDHFARIVPQGSPSAALGNPYQIMSASNCIVIESPDDSIEGIMRAGTELAQLMKRRAGVGLDISRLRPEGFTVNNAAKTTSGCWSFADFFSYVTRMIAQKGRRGALMISISVHHPDVEKFARMKADLKKVTGANISIRLTDEFLEAVENDEDYEQRWPCEGTPKYSRKIPAKQVWDTVVSTATTTAEPALLFWNRMISRLPAHSYPQFKTICVNPCGEINLSAYDSCRLISINLTGYVRDAFIGPSFDWDGFKADIHLGMHMIDNLVDIELEQIRKIQKVCGTESEVVLWEKLYTAGEKGRRTGLGTHGLGDMLAQLCIKYDSQEALDFCDKLYTTLRDTAYVASTDLAEIRGPFPIFDWEVEKNNEFIKDLPESIRKRMRIVGRRNISILTQAPTGTTSMLSKCGEFDRHNISSGVEPMFRSRFSRRKKVNDSDGNTSFDFVDDLGDKWKTYDVYHGNILSYFEKTQGVAIQSLEDPKTQKRLETFYKALPEFFVGSDDIDWKFRVELQGVEQHKIDHSISSTINLPRGTDPSVVGNIYMDAWKKGLKGVTVYVDGSRDGVLITDEEDKIDPNVRPDKIIRMQSPKRHKELECDIHHHSVKGEKWVAIVGLLGDDPYEMFGGYSKQVHLPKKYKRGVLKRRAQGKYDLYIPVGDEELVIRDIVGTFNDDEIGWTTRLVSTALRHGTPIPFLVQQLGKSGNIQSFSRVISRVLKKYIPDGEKVKTSVKCGNNCALPEFIYSEGCVKCVCGWTKCQ